MTAVKEIAPAVAFLPLPGSDLASLPNRHGSLQLGGDPVKIQISQISPFLTSLDVSLQEAREVTFSMAPLKIPGHGDESSLPEQLIAPAADTMGPPGTWWFPPNAWEAPQELPGYYPECWTPCWTAAPPLMAVPPPPAEQPAAPPGQHLAKHDFAAEETPREAASTEAGTSPPATPLPDSASSNTSEDECSGPIGAMHDLSSQIKMGQELLALLIPEMTEVSNPALALELAPRADSQSVLPLAPEGTTLAPAPGLSESEKVLPPAPEGTALAPPPGLTPPPGLMPPPGLCDSGTSPGLCDPGAPPGLYDSGTPPGLCDQGVLATMEAPLELTLPEVCTAAQSDIYSDAVVECSAAVSQAPSISEQVPTSCLAEQPAEHDNSTKTFVDDDFSAEAEQEAMVLNASAVSEESNLTPLPELQTPTPATIKSCRKGNKAEGRLRAEPKQHRMKAAAAAAEPQQQQTLSAPRNKSRCEPRQSKATIVRLPKHKKDVDTMDADFLSAKKETEEAVAWWQVLLTIGLVTCLLVALVSFRPVCLSAAPATMAPGASHVWAVAPPAGVSLHMQGRSVASLAKSMDIEFARGRAFASNMMSKLKALKQARKARRQHKEMKVPQGRFAASTRR